MKTLIHWLLVLSLIVNQKFVYSEDFKSDWYVETNPAILLQLTPELIGTVHRYVLKGGGVREYRVESYEFRPDGQSALIIVKPINKVVSFDFENEVEEFGGFNGGNDRNAPRGTTTHGTEVESGDTQVSSGSGGFSFGDQNWSAGVNPAVMGAIQSAAVELTPYKAQIQNFQRQLHEVSNRIKGTQQRMVTARLNLQTGASVIEFQSKTAGAQIRTSLKGNSVFNSRLQLKEILESYNQNDSINWMSTDPQFKAEAQALEQSLKNTRPKTTAQAEFKAIGQQSLRLADIENYLSDKETQEFYLNIAKTSLDFLVGWDPVTGTARSVYEATTGKNMVLQTELSTLERTFAFVGVITGGYGLKGAKAVKALQKLAVKLSPKAQAAWLRAAAAFEKLNVGQRKLILQSEKWKDPLWGSSNYHLDKHFFGETFYSLKKLDPGGNVDEWMANIAKLIDKEPIHIEKQNLKYLLDGKSEVEMKEIVGYFPKKNGLGEYRLGIRVTENPQGDYYLVTILTRQDK